MEKSQFVFSLSVGIGLVAAGAAITTQASIGMPLMALGAAIAGLSLVTHAAARQKTLEIRVPIKSESDLNRS